MQLQLLMMSGMPLETCWAFNERWNNKIYYKVASCWSFLLSHTMMHGSMTIKFAEGSLHIRSSSLAASVQTVVISLHVFLSLSCPFLLGIGCWLSYSYIVPLWWSQNFHTCKKYKIFITLKSSGHLALVGYHDRLFQPIKLGWMGSVCVVTLVEDASDIADWVPLLKL